MKFFDYFWVMVIMVFWTIVFTGWLGAWKANPGFGFASTFIFAPYTYLTKKAVDKLL